MTEHGKTVLKPMANSDGAAWSRLEQLLDEHAVATGIGDLAHQHDHYVHGTPKRSESPSLLPDPRTGLLH